MTRKLSDWYYSSLNKIKKKEILCVFAFVDFKSHAPLLTWLDSGKRLVKKKKNSGKLVFF